jgi:hypothetical protein
MKGELFISRYQKFSTNEFVMENLHLGGIKPTYKHGIKITLPSSYSSNEKHKVLKRLNDLVY